MNGHYKEDSDGHHFLALLGTEISRLNALICATEKELEEDNDIAEDIKGKMRIAVGKARMLLKKKFRLFEDLCHKNVGNDSNIRYPVTSEDLAGYWETIVIQILQVYKIFEEVETSRQNSISQVSPTKSQKIERNFTSENTVTN